MITFDGIIFSAKNRYGGVSVYFKKLIEHTARSEEEMGVLVHEPTITPAQLSCEPEQLMFRAPRMMERFRSVRGVHAGIFHSSYYRVCRQPNVRSVVTVYDFTYEKFVSGPRAIAHSLQKRRAIEHADAVICISENTRRDLLERLPRCNPKKIFVTHLAADERYRPLADIANPHVPTTPFVLFVGLRSGYKNFSLAVDAVRLLEGITLVCVGGGAFTDKESAALRRALPGRHHHAGTIDLDTLNAFYNSAICLLYPSLYEGFGIPPLEAMQAGCPCIVINSSSIPEVVGSAAIMLENPDGLQVANAIERCLQSTDRTALVSAGFVQAKKFSWERTVADTWSIYKALHVA